MKVLYAAVLYPIHDTPCILLVLTYVLVVNVCMVLDFIFTAVNTNTCSKYGLLVLACDMLLVCIHSRSYSRSVARPKFMTRTTKYYRKRASVRVQQYHNTSKYVVNGTVRTRMIRTRYILRILVSRDTGSVSRPHTHWYASTSIAERGLVV